MKYLNAVFSERELDLLAGALLAGVRDGVRLLEVTIYQNDAKFKLAELEALLGRIEHGQKTLRGSGGQG